MNVAIDTERFIDEVHARPILWDSNLEEYRDRTKTKDAWISIVTLLAPEISSNKEKDELGRELQMKWRNLKDALMRSERNLNSKTLSGLPRAKKRYRYANQMSFLKKNGTPRQPSKKGNRFENGVMQNEDDHSNEILLHIKNEDTSNDSERLSTINADGSLEENDLEKGPDLRITQLSTTKEQQLDDDMCFFQSLLPAVRMLDIQQKLTFRINVMSLLQENFH